MNPQEYIESGILDLYAAGALTDAERAEVEKMASVYPEIAEELERIGQALESYASSEGIRPRPAMKQKVMNAVLHPDTGRTIKPAPIPMLFSYYRIAIAASISLLILSTIGMMVFRYNWKSAEKELKILSETNNQMLQDMAAMRIAYEKEKTTAGMLRNPDVMSLELKGMPVSPAASAMVYWNTKDQTVMLDPVNLPAPPAGQQYQLWFIKDGKPLDAGIFPMDAPGTMQLMKKVADADAFAITLEPKGGSVSPTLDKMYVYTDVRL